MGPSTKKGRPRKETGDKSSKSKKNENKESQIVTDLGNNNSNKQ